ncbi:MAG: FMN-binding negative transcriptional regulator [Paracoccaceae bacterium]
MHPNPVFRSKTAARDLAFARDLGFGLLIADGPMVAHVPFLLADDGNTADLHLLRSNPIARAVAQGDVPAVIAVQGPQGYISPDWYEVADQVPTWNYVAVHLRGRLMALTDDALPDLLDRQSDHFEATLDPKPRWTTDKMTPEVYARMRRSIVPARLTIETVDATWKLSQNKPDAVRLRAADGVQAQGAADLADLMRTPPEL